MKYLDDYRKLHEANAFGGMTLARFADPVVKLIRSHDCKTVLDYGSARGQAWEQVDLLKKLRAEQAVVTLYDPGVQEHATPPPREVKFDAVICMDVVEHVPEEEIDEVIGDLFRYAERVVIATFCPRGSKKKLPSTGADVHVSQHDRLWWEQRFHAANSARTKPIPWFLFENP